MSTTTNISAIELVRKAQMIASDLTEIRRAIHRYPELGFKEKRTASLIDRRLTQLGIAPVRKVAGTGLVADLEGCGPGPVIVLRADMDALPIQEETGASYASLTKGVMHACGHDAHVACVLGAAELLMSLRHCYCGVVKLIFQPAEEIDLGAKAIIAEGCLEDPLPNAIFGLHVDPEIPVGQILLKKGTWMAAIDTFRIRVTGKGGHASAPHKCIDAIVAGAAIVMNLQSVVSRQVDPLVPLVVSVGTFNSGRAENIIASTAELTGTVRCIDPQVYCRIPKQIEYITTQTSAAFHAKASLDYRRVIPPLVNDPAMTEIIMRSAESAFGRQAILEDSYRLGGDDFGCYLETIPGAYFHLGAKRSGDTQNSGLHTSDFDIDESCLPIGAALLTHMALSILHTNERCP